MNLDDLIPKPIDYDCPDAGKVQMLPYFSSAAFDNVMRHENEPSKALEAALGKVVTGGAEHVAKLSEPDRVYLARQLLESVDAVSQFDQLSASLPADEAFVGALKKTDLWQKTEKSNAEIQRMAERFANPLGHLGSVYDVLSIGSKHPRLMEQLESAANLYTASDTVMHLTEQLAAAAQMSQQIRSFDSVYSKIGAELMKFPGPPAALEVPSAFDHLKIASAISPNDIFSAATRSLQQLDFAHIQMSAMGNFLQKADDQVAIMKGPGIDISMLNAIRDDVARIAIIAEPMPAVLKIFAEAKSAMESHRNLMDAAHLLNQGILESFKPVALTNDFFGKPYALPDFAIPGEIFQSHTERPDSAEVSPARVVHRATSDVVITTNTITSLFVTEFHKTVGEKVEEKFQEHLGPLLPLLNRIKRLSDPHGLGDVLLEFSKTFGRNYWKELWDEPGDKFKSRPEYLAKALLGMYLAPLFEGIAFVGQELRNGAGFVDLLVHFLGMDYVLELKMVGAAYGYGNALDGADQLDQYLFNYQKQEGYLVIFDGRKTDAGKTFPPEIQGKNGKITVIVVRCYFESPTGKR